MTDAFEKWINSFTEEEYDEMLDDANPFGFSDAQKEKALNIRDMPTKEELEDLELEQEFTEQPVIDESGTFTTKGKVTIVREPTIQEPTIDISGSTAQPIPTPIPISRPTVKPPVPKPRAIAQAIKTAVKSGISFARRFFRI